MTARRTAVPTSELRARLALTLPELAQLLGVSAGHLRRHMLEDADGNPIKVGDVAPDGSAWVRWCGIRLPARRNVNGHLRFLTTEILPLLDNAGQQLHPAGVDR